MNDLRRSLLWLAALASLAVGMWGFNRDEVTAARPFAEGNRAFRLHHRVNLLGHEFALPLRRMASAWVAIAAAAASLWPFATDPRARGVFGRWERPPRSRSSPAKP